MQITGQPSRSAARCTFRSTEKFLPRRVGNSPFLIRRKADLASA